VEETIRAGLAPSSAFQNQLDGRNMVSRADNNAEGTPLLVFESDVPGADIIDVPVTHGIRVVDVIFHKNGAGGGGVVAQVLNVSDAITNNHATNIPDNAASRLTGGTDTIDDAFHEIAAGNILETTSGGPSGAVDVFVLGVRT